MSTTSSRLHLKDWKQLLTDIRKSITNGTIDKLFENEDFVFDLLKLMYEDAVDTAAKTEYLATLEQFASEALSASSVDQAASTLLNIFQRYRSRDDYVNVCVQLLITVTTLTVSSEAISRDVCVSVVDALWGVAASVNDVASRRLRGCACQCLYQLEEFVPGVLWKWKDSVLQAAREDRTDVCQDYVCLLAKILHHMTQAGTEQDSTEQNVKLQRLNSDPPILSQELLPPVSFIMDVCAILTPAGLWNIVLSLVATLRKAPQISPSIFKPLMLHHMATLDPTVLHIIVYLQMEYSTETLSESEENKLLSRLVIGVNHAALSPAHRLLLLQWIKGYSKKRDQKMTAVSPHIKDKLFSKFFPSVFDSLDIHAEKLSILNHCLAGKKDCCGELLSSLQYLQKLVQLTGEVKATLAFFKSLFRFYQLQNNEQITQAILKITLDVIAKFPHLIPLVMDFLQCIKESIPERSVYMDILSSLHTHVLEASPETVLQQYEYYLQVFKTSAKEKDINQEETLKCLHRVVKCVVCLDQCSWYFGSDVLAVCRNILLHHSTDSIFSVLGEMLFDMFHHYNDTDVRDRARFYYALLTGASDKKIQDVLSAMMQGEAVTEHNFTTLLPGTLSEPVKTELIETDHSLFVWRRLTLQPRISVRGIVQDSTDKLTHTDFLTNYFKRLESLEVEIEVKYSLKMNADSEFEVIHAVSIHVEACEKYQPVKDIHIACMEKNDERQVSVILKPSVPKPGCFNISVMFASETKTHLTVLPQLCLSFPDLLIPFPWQQLNMMEDDFISESFTSLWDYFTCDDRQPSESIQSIKILQCPLKSIQTVLSPYCVNGDVLEHRYAIFLPGRHHLLLKVMERADEEKLVVMIATDYWPVLPHVNSYLESVQ
ncbi:AP-5 complex subunit beta-1-like [Gigantopelta aegis]|uniref:AP-5 complex subunit beta-1-like n=1 Tax=Gigantopelta aegis TaxID=1735272 RepID=UPI001B889552|nr:AP-5 complex subunit beta-1-like [Gigantopelta aegis]